MMRHPVFDVIDSLSDATDEALENAVDEIISEAKYAHSPFGGGFGLEDQAARAEALAILAHEFRRRTPTEDRADDSA